MGDQKDRTASAESGHGSPDLPSVRVESYNLEVTDQDGFVGDKARKGAFLEILEDLQGTADVSLEASPKDLSKRQIDGLLRDGDPERAGLIHSAVEEFAQRLAAVIRRYLRLRAWRNVERIVIGGGFRQSRVGELAIGRTMFILGRDGVEVDLVPISHHSNEAGLVGCAHLAPIWMFEAYDSIVGIDIGGSNIRCGIIRLRHKEAPDLSRAEVWRSSLWRHVDDDPKRDEAIERLGEMLQDLIRAASGKMRLAPFIGIGCPGMIGDDGSIARGAQNLPGNWESSRFNLVARIKEIIPIIGEHDTMVLMHNDAVVQGLSELPHMQDVERWGVLTIGTGLGNASYSNKRAGDQGA